MGMRKYWRRFQKSVQGGRSSQRQRQKSRPLALLQLEERLAPSTITIDTLRLTTARAGDNSWNQHAFYGGPFAASVVNNVAQFRIAGDLNVPAGVATICDRGFRLYL